MRSLGLAVFFFVACCSRTTAGASDPSAAVFGEIDSHRGNTTALRDLTTSGWISAPNYRGTSDILWSCIVTLVACVYTALHLNIPGRSGKWRRLLQKLKWTVTALLAPEVVLYVASSQFLRARTLARELREEHARSEKIDKEVRSFFRFAFALPYCLPVPCGRSKCP